MSRIEWRPPFILSLCLLLSACMGPNPWTTDPVTECRSLGFAPDSRQFSECLIVNKGMQRSHAEAETTAKRSNAEIEAAAAQARPRVCDPSTGLCTPSLLKPQDLTIR